jgi:hypothetical protein
MTKKSAVGSGILHKADDAPELTDAFFAAATVHDGDKVVRRGRAKLAAPKRLVTIRFPAATLGRKRPSPENSVPASTLRGRVAGTSLKRQVAFPRISHADVDRYPPRSWATRS